jgi:hypothetical protein
LITHNPASRRLAYGRLCSRAGSGLVGPRIANTPAASSSHRARVAATAAGRATGLTTAGASRESGPHCGAAALAGVQAPLARFERPGSRRGAVAMPNSFAPLAATKRSYTFSSHQPSRGHRGWARGSEANVKGVLPNKPINPTRFSASRRLLAQASRRASRAGYRQR